MLAVAHSLLPLNDGSRCRGPCGVPFRRSISNDQAPLPEIISSHKVPLKIAVVVVACRERQRCIVSCLEADVTDKLSQLQLLAAENDKLKLRGSVLEAAVQSREDQVGGGGVYWP
jgi:hypothetical protein